MQIRLYLDEDAMSRSLARELQACYPTRASARPLRAAIAEGAQAMRMRGPALTESELAARRFSALSSPAARARPLWKEDDEGEHEMVGAALANDMPASR